MKLSTATVAFTSPDSTVGHTGWAGDGDPNHPTALLSSALDPKFLEPWALLLNQHKLGEGGDRTSNMVLPFLSSPEAGGSRKAVVPGTGYSPNLASAVSFRIFSYCGERRASGGARALSPAPCPDPSVRNVLGRKGISKGAERLQNRLLWGS